MRQKTDGMLILFSSCATKKKSTKNTKAKRIKAILRLFAVRIAITNWFSIELLLFRRYWTIRRCDFHSHSNKSLLKRLAFHSIQCPLSFEYVECVDFKSIINRSSNALPRVCIEETGINSGHFISIKATHVIFPELFFPLATNIFPLQNAPKWWCLVCEPSIKM